MKKIIIALLFVCFAALPASAQKFGYVNSQELILALPDTKLVEENLAKMGDEYTLQIEEMQVEGNKKVEAFQKEEATLSESMRQIRREEITNIGQRIEQLSSRAQQEMAAKEAEMLEPIIEKVRAAIEKVMKAQGLAGVFEIQALISTDPAQMVDVTPLAKKELGIE
jgi:outer membrane protein